VLFSTILFCRFLLHPKMSLEDAVLTVGGWSVMLSETDFGRSRMPSTCALCGERLRADGGCRRISIR